MVARPILFARYAYGPNRLGYCGPDDFDALFGEATSGGRGDLGGLRRQAQEFEGAYPYLQLIAESNDIADPLDARVVDAYWLGNPLLSNVSPRSLGESMDHRFKRRLGGDGWRWLADKPNVGALPMHAFHVLDVFPRLGLMRGGAVENALTVMDSCRIRWGRVLERDTDFLVVSAVPLTMVAGKLELAPARVERVRAWRDGVGFIGDVVAGDVMSIHWDWACEKLDAARLAAFQFWTRHEMDIANCTI